MKSDLKTKMTSISSTSFGGGAETAGEPIERETSGNLEQRIADLESRPRMPASGTGNDGDALVLDGPSPRWGAGALPDGDEDGDILYWNTAKAPEAGWDVLDRPSEAGKLLKTTALNIEWDYLKWR